ncbi:MAG: energy transducer TonB [bacterium]|nr:energy transducer TonB [bacterium]
MLQRYVVSIGLAGLVTFSLLFMMQSLISMPGKQASDTGKSGSLEFVRLKRETATEARKRTLPKKQENKPPPPPPPDFSPASAPDPGAETIAIAMPGMGADIELSGGVNLGSAPADTEATPILRVPAVYPPRASERGIEGWVDIEFTISPIGTVLDPVVIASHPSSIFNRSALRCVKKWKYRPKVVDGVGVPQEGIVTRIQFNLSDLDE